MRYSRNEVFIEKTNIKRDSPSHIKHDHKPFNSKSLKITKFEMATIASNGPKITLPDRNSYNALTN